MVTLPVAAPPPTIILVSPTVSPSSPKRCASPNTSEPSVNRVHHPQRFDPSFLASLLLQSLPLQKKPLIHPLHPALTQHPHPAPVHHAPPTLTPTPTPTPTVSPTVSTTPNPIASPVPSSPGECDDPSPTSPTSTGPGGDTALSRPADNPGTSASSAF
jgi:hypothetical protein